MKTSEDEAFFEKLKNHPRLKKRFYEILGIAENTSGELITADEAETKALWMPDLVTCNPNCRSIQQVEILEKQNKTRRHVKKNSIGKQHSEELKSKNS